MKYLLMPLENMDDWVALFRNSNMALLRTVGLRFPKNQERGAFQVFNAKFENVFETENETILLLTKKWWTAGKIFTGASDRKWNRKWNRK